MKLLYYTHTYFLDCDLPLIEQLVQKGVDVMLVIDLPYYQLKSTMVSIANQIPKTDLLPSSTYQELEFISHYLPKERSYILNRTSKVYHIDNFVMRRKFHNLVRDFNPDILQCTDFIDFSDFFLYRYSSKLLQVVHDPFPHSGERTWKKRILRSLEFKLIKNYVLLNSKQEKKFVAQNKLKTSYVYQASLGVYSCLQEFKNEQNILDDEQYILFFGRISPYKGVEYLIHAVELLHKENLKINLVIAGGGTLYFESLLKNKPYIKVLNKFLSMDELYSLIEHCKFVVCPYVDATQSGVIMSAFALNKVVVGTDVGGLPQMLGYGDYGPIVPPRDGKALALAMKGLFSDATLQKYELKIKEAITNGDFSWKRIADKYIDIFKKIMHDAIV